jgi:hypothetical protein
MRFCESWQELQAPLVTAAVMARGAPVPPVTFVYSPAPNPTDRDA